CSSTKEFLSKNSIAFEARDVENDPKALAELRALGIRNVPVTVLGDKTVIGFNREELTQLFKLSVGEEKQIADAALFATLDKMLQAVIRAARQVPPDHLDWCTPDRDRPLKVFCYHILADPNHVLDAIATQKYDGSFKLMYAKDAEPFLSMEAVARFGEETLTRLKAASGKLSAEVLERPIDGYAGQTNGHELLHQVLSHTAHHLRQLYAMLRMIGVEPADPLGEGDFTGIRMPQDLW
ncbi:MAG: DinB family protein, partial [Candidatus Binatia bacterium]